MTLSLWLRGNGGTVWAGACCGDLLAGGNRGLQAVCCPENCLDGTLSGFCEAENLVTLLYDNDRKRI